jgi:hypothetical protein
LIVALNAIASLSLRLDLKVQQTKPMVLWAIKVMAARIARYWLLKTRAFAVVDILEVNVSPRVLILEASAAFILEAFNGVTAIWAIGLTHA